jgi:peptidoglycan-associated lipoprotein
MRRLLMLVVVLALVFAMVTLTTSCSRKQLRSEEESKGVAGYKAGGTGQGTGESARLSSGASTGASSQMSDLEQEREQKQRMAMQAFESESIYFDFDKSDLTAEARAILDKKAGWLRSNPQYRLRIEGHCDNRGSNEYNVALGERRADAAMKYLVAQGIPVNHLSTISYGEERPKCTQETEACWATNRRDEFKLSK